MSAEVKTTDWWEQLADEAEKVLTADELAALLKEPEQVAAAAGYAAKATEEPGVNPDTGVK